MENARTPEQKRAVLDRIYCAWLAVPHLSLGNFLDQSNMGIYDKRDTELVENAEAFAEANSK